MARPQIHGFGINCAKLLPNGYLFSVAEEKVIFLLFIFKLDDTCIYYTNDIL